MTINDVTQQILTHELQLGEKLNECVHSDRRPDFSLMLAMLADDVRLQSQFILPKTDIHQKDLSEQQLRKSLHLADKARLAITTPDEINEYNQAQFIQQQSLEQLRLIDVLKPKPLAFRDDVKFVSHEVKTNTSIHCQQSLNKDIDMSIERLDFDAKSWLDGVKSTMKHSNIQVSA